MYVRCSDCLSTSWVEILTPTGVAPSVDCRACGRTFALTPSPALGTKPGEHFRATIRLAQEHKLETPSAFAVLIGIMSLDQALILRASLCEHADPSIEIPDVKAPAVETPAVETPAVETRAVETPAVETPAVETRAVEVPAVRAPAVERPAGGTSTASTPAARPTASVTPAVDATPRTRPTERALPGVDHDLDPGYRNAIARGTLTLQEALTRGDRAAYAARLMRRHGLSQSMALRVADNRMSVSEAVRWTQQAQRGAPRPKKPAPAQPGTLRTALIALLTVTTLGASATLTWKKEQEPMPARTPILAPAAVSEEQAGEAAPAAPEAETLQANLSATTQVRDDGEGRILEIVGPDPRTVLIRYCESAGAGSALEALEITSTVPPFGDARLGLFRDFREEGAIYAIRIRRDGTSGRWVAGSGRSPIVPRRPPELPADALRTPVSAGTAPSGSYSI